MIPIASPPYQEAHVPNRSSSFQLSVVISSTPTTRSNVFSSALMVECPTEAGVTRQTVSKGRAG